MNNKLSKLGELIEHTNEVAKLLIASEVALNDGEIEVCQKNSAKAVDMLKTITQDVFVEIEEELSINNDNFTSDLDPNALNLAYALCDVAYNAGVIVNMLVENEADKVLDIAKTKLIHAINDAKSLYTTLYL